MVLTFVFAKGQSTDTDTTVLANPSTFSESEDFFSKYVDKDLSDSNATTASHNNCSVNVKMLFMLKTQNGW